jgi:hypothetical protein
MRKLKASPFRHGSEWGFAALPDAQDKPHFRFLWRAHVPVLGIDAAGNQTRELVQSIDYFVFAVFASKDDVWVRIEDPPRGTQAFFNSLELVTGPGLSVEPYAFSQKQQMAVLSHFDESRLVGMRGVGTSTELKLVARIEVASKAKIDTERLPFLRGLQYTVDHSSFEVTQARLRGNLTFTASGTVKVSGPLQPFIVAQLENYLPSRKSSRQP